MSANKVCGQSLNYYSKQYFSEMEVKSKAKKFTPISFRQKQTVPLVRTSQQKEKKQKLFQISYAIEVKQVDTINEFNESMAHFFFDESRPSEAQSSKSFQLSDNPAQYYETTQNTPLKVTIPAKINDDSEDQSRQQINHQQQQPKIPPETKKVLSQPDMECPMSPPLLGIPRRKTQYLIESKSPKPKAINKSKKGMDRLLKRFAKYQEKGDESTKNLEDLGRIAEKIEEDDIY